MPFPTFDNVEAVDAAQAQLGSDGKRQYETDSKFRTHVESERIRLAEGRPVAAPAVPGITGTSGMDNIGRRVWADGQGPDPRLGQLTDALQARLGPDGRRMYDTDETWRASVEKSRQETLSGKAQWSAASEAMLENLKAEAASQAKDSGLYRGLEKTATFHFDRNDPQWQSAAAKAAELGLSDKQFQGLMEWQGAQQTKDSK